MNISPSLTESRYFCWECKKEFDSQVLECPDCGGDIVAILISV